MVIVTGEFIRLREVMKSKIQAQKEKYAKKKLAKRNIRLLNQPVPIIIKPAKIINYTNPEKILDPAWVNGPDFLNSYEWHSLRMKALIRDKGTCLCCGINAKCGAIMNVDHIKNRRQWPQLALSLDNLQTLCAPCNHGKGNWDSTDWRTNG